MSISIRMARVGKKHAPAYKIVVANTRDKRNGRFLDVIGHYNPSMKPIQYNLDEAKYAEWISKGALTTASIDKLREGKYSYTPYNPKADKAAALNTTADSMQKTETPVNEDSQQTANTQTEPEKTVEATQEQATEESA